MNLAKSGVRSKTPAPAHSSQTTWRRHADAPLWGTPLRAMKRLLPLLAITLVVQPVIHSLAQTPVVDGFSFVKNVGGIAEYKLTANDLNVLILEDHSAPVLTFMVTYRVGSRNEVTGTTGATHLLEHLMFKGSKNFHPGIGKGFDTLMDRVGGINNATTWLDRTNYYENLPSDHLELAVQLEADRMRNLLLREEDRQPEMTVVRNEFERGRKRSGRRARQGGQRDRVHRPPVSSSDDRLALRHREGLDRKAARVLRHVLLAGQRDHHGHRRLQARCRPALDQAILRHRSPARRNQSRRSTPRSPHRAARVVSSSSAPARSASCRSASRFRPRGMPTTRRSTCSPPCSATAKPAGFTVRSSIPTRPSTPTPRRDSFTTRPFSTPPPCSHPALRMNRPRKRSSPNWRR